jgi:asparagine synthase (glutamine-hydrolysing)
MFAFAIWDGRTETMLIARDRFGVKPVYWASTADGGLVFGSELTTVLASGCVEPRLDIASVGRYLTLGYVVGEDSAIVGVRRLAPANFLVWRRGRPIRIGCYWNMAQRWAELAENPEPADATEHFISMLDTATADRLASDVPLGVLLSGGIDSSVVTALMRRHCDHVRSFSCGFRNDSFDELPFARLAAHQIGTCHEDDIADCDGPETLMEIASRLDEPFADTSIVPTHLLCKLARRHITVALSGDGGDELLAGYVTHSADVRHRQFRRLPRIMLRSLRGIARMLPDDRRKVSFAFKLKQFLAGSDLTLCDAHAWWRMLGTESDITALLHRDWKATPINAFDPFRQAYEEAQALSPVDRFLYVDYKTWLVDDILTKVDRASMAHGLEVRSPLLDHRLFEFCATLRPERKRRGRETKAILRDAARDIVPRSILRRSKRGFNAPVADWLDDGWRELVDEYLGRAKISEVGLLDADRVNTLVHEHRSRRRNHGHLLFALLQLSLWVDRVRPSISSDSSDDASRRRRVPIPARAKAAFAA